MLRVRVCEHLRVCVWDAYDIFAGIRLQAVRRVARSEALSRAMSEWRLATVAPRLLVRTSHVPYDTQHLCSMPPFRMRLHATCTHPAPPPAPRSSSPPAPPVPLPSPSPSPNMRLKIGSTDAWPAVTTFAHNVQLPPGSPHSSASRSACAIDSSSQDEIARLQAEIAKASLHGALTSTASGGLPQIPLSAHAGFRAALPRPRPPAAATPVAAPVACIVTTAIDHHVEPAAGAGRSEVRDSPKALPQ
jgi:hypothetical protein